VAASGTATPANSDNRCRRTNRIAGSDTAGRAHLRSAARRLLGPRHRSVFSPMGRICLQIDNRERASELSICRGGIGIGAQSWALKKKLLEVDTLMTPATQRAVYEVHPEISFCAMNGGQPLIQSKKSPDGERLRVKALKEGDFPESLLAPLRDLHSGRDDFLDACAALCRCHPQG
jgi:predicted RNase H-like nuclease